VKDPQSMPDQRARDDKLVKALLEGAGQIVRAPQGFSRKVMNAVFRESLAGRDPAAAARETFFVTAARTSRPTVARIYRRLGLCFMVTAAVLAVSLLIPHAGYSTLIGGSPDAILGAGPSAAVENVLVGAGHAVQGALGEQEIGGNQE
jgi:hypothetical protein